MKTWLKKVFLCHVMKAHDWTCAAIEGKPPTRAQLEGGVAGFFDYATTYCKRCGKESLSSIEAKEKARG